MNRFTQSMRQQILFGLVCSLILILGVAGLVSYKVALHEADEIFSARLATSARVLELLLARQVEHATLNHPLVMSLPPELAQAPSDKALASGHPYETNLAFQVWSQTGQLLVRSQAAPDEPLSAYSPGFAEQPADGRWWHVFTLKSGDVWIQVGEEVGFRKEIADDIGLVLSSPLIVGAVLLFVLVNLIVIVGFRPLKNLARVIQHRDPKDNSQIKIEKMPAEIEPVVGALNNLLGRVREVMARERRFTDSAAHELRTPLAALSLHAENMISAENEEQRASSQAQLLTGLSRTKHLVEQMLMYSRLSSHTDGEAFTKIELVHELQYLVDRQNLIVQDLGLSVKCESPSEKIWVKAQLGALEIMIRNLLDNACKYNSELEKPVMVKLQYEDHAQWFLTISNPSQPISEQQLEQVFEPYFRLPNASQKGNGLGLAMVKEVADFHGWKVRFEYDTHLKVAKVVVSGAC